MREQLTISVTVTITTDRATWYREHGDDAAVGMPDYVLTTLRELPRIQASDGQVRLARLTRRGRAATRQLPRHRSPVPDPFLVDRTTINPNRTHRHRLNRHPEPFLARAVSRIARKAFSSINCTNDPMPKSPSGQFLHNSLTLDPHS
ncbi:hypothetical protein MOQ72_14325 [Saccharopolyspora sp. K220]|uniref:hypothetical protein n=1 Tax=Saccharopolyspora soli TaxID=2926618 RepID=UPI001F5A3591|nr:hypothetical protein [Saccharopolyspora soli]MCI2418613.1 hypothetical protein [Saccharopolyspora soli]